MTRRRGRPRIDEDDESVLVTVTLPARAYDRIARQAVREQVSVPAIIRRELHAARETRDSSRASTPPDPT